MESSLRELPAERGKPIVHWLHPVDSSLLFESFHHAPFDHANLHGLQHSSAAGAMRLCSPNRPCPRPCFPRATCQSRSPLATLCFTQFCLAEDLTCDDRLFFTDSTSIVLRTRLATRTTLSCRCLVRPSHTLASVPLSSCRRSSCASESFTVAQRPIA